MRKISLKNFLICLFFVFCSLCVLNASFADEEPSWKDSIPSELKEWVKWVSKDIKQNNCPKSYKNINDSFCLFVTSLKISLENNELFFTQNVYLYEDSFVRLLGDERLLPNEAKENDEVLPIVFKHKLPYVFLRKGGHEIKGSIKIQNNETEVSLPERVAIIKFIKDGKNENDINIINNKLQFAVKNQEILDTAQNKQDEFNDSIDIQVRRILEDDVPFNVSTLLRINVSGKERDENLGKITFNNSRIVNVISALPIRFDENQNFIFKVRRGSFEIRIDSVLNDIPSSIPFFKSANNFPSKEIWGYIVNNELRTTQISGVNNISPINFGYPITNKSMRVYEINENESFNITQKERAPMIDAKNELTLQRHLWLNFKGDGYFALDELKGSIKRNSVMTVNSDFKIAKAKINSSDVPLLVDKETSKTGLNLHQGYVNIQSEGRYKNIKEISLAPFSFVKGNVSLKLELPAGWKIFNIKNIKDDNFSWVSKWNLLKLFYLFLTCFILIKVFSLRAGIVALISMVLMHDSGISLYLPLILIGFFHFIETLLYGNESKKLYFNIANKLKGINIIFVIIIFVPFVIYDIRSSIYPQLKFDIERQNSSSYSQSNNYRRTVTAGAMMKSVHYDSALEEDGAMPMQDVSLGANAPAKEPTKVNSPNLAVPTGYGKPMWKGVTTFNIYENVIDNSKKIYIYYLSPTINTIISFLRAIFLGWLIILLVNTSMIEKIKDYMFNKFPKMISCFLLFFVAMLCANLSLNVASVNAEPSSETLKELKEYVQSNISKAPSCMPNCVSIPFGKVNFTSNDSSIELKINVLSDIAFPIAKNSLDYVVDGITVDDTNIKRAIKTLDDNIWIFLNKGKHDVKIRFTLRNLNMPNFLFEIPIAKLMLNLENYEYLGNTSFIKDFKLKRLNTSMPSNASLDGNKTDDNQNLTQTKSDRTELKLLLSSYYHITKELLLNDTEFKLVTEIRRYGNVDLASSIELSLNKDEKILTSNIDVKNNKMRVDFAKGENYKKVESRLPLASSIDISSQNLDFVFEKWKIYQSESWQTSFSGVPEIIKGNDRFWVPRKGEVLKVAISPIKNADAPYETITSSKIEYQLEEKDLKATLNFVIRSSHGGKHEFNFPKEFKLDSCYINNNKVPCTTTLKDALNVSIELIPQEQNVKFIFNAPLNWKTIYKLPKIDVNINSVNSIIKATINNKSAKRLLLWVRGPKMGACVLFWITLPIIIFLAIFFKYGLSSQITFKQWFVLLLGCSLLQSYMASFILILWLILGVFVLRNSNKEKNVVSQNNNDLINNEPNNKEANTLTKEKKNIIKGNKKIWVRIYSLFSFLAIINFCLLIKIALLGETPNMWVAGNGSYMNLTTTYLVWYQDIISKILPIPEIISVSIIYYKIFIVFWAIWSTLFIIRYLTKLIRSIIGNE